MVKWTREQIIRQILRRESAGLPLTPGGENGVESMLYQAGTRIFGSWRNAVKSAGIAPDRAQAHEQWSPARILTVIRSLARRRHPPRRAELKSRFGSLMQAARRIYGSWPKAVIAAGVDPIKFRRVSPWTRERIIEAVLTRALKNEPLNSGAVRPKSLVEAGIRIFGNWGSALAAAGLDVKQYAGYSSSGGHASVDTLKPIEQQLGHAIDAQGPAMTLVAAKTARHRSPKEVIQAILARLHENKPMNAVAVRNDDKSLYWATKKRFGCWRGALLAAGLNADEFRKHGGRQRSGQAAPAT